MFPVFPLIKHKGGYRSSMKTRCMISELKCLGDSTNATNIFQKSPVVIFECKACRPVGDSLYQGF